MAKKISVVIPNYNGKSLLLKNLPQVLKNCPNCEIIVVDDASTDDSVTFIKNNFKKVRVIECKTNKGFANAVNTGVENASGDLVLLLNSDVSPRPNFLKEASEHFEKDKGNLFAVGLADYSHENGKVVERGRGAATFKKGFLSHFKAQSTAGETLWVSGGSSLVDRQKFLEVGGFDHAYAPFYWEDIDLCWRAQKSGYICLFEPKSKVDHYHEQGAIKKHYRPFFVKTISYRNQFLFVWKNISDTVYLLSHILWLPYHLAKSTLTLDIAFITGFILAIAKIPNLILNFQFSTLNSKLSDREVLSKFEQ